MEPIGKTIALAEDECTSHTGETEIPVSTTTTAPSSWFGTPMEMVADAFGMKSPWRNALDNGKACMRNKLAKRARRRKLAEASRRKNRRK